MKGLLELIEQSSKLKQEVEVEDLKNEVSELKNEVTDLNDGVNMELRDVNKGLQAEIKELKDKQGNSMSMMTE
jgi:cell division protein FtsB